jgi:hypothetical protein
MVTPQLDCDPPVRQIANPILGGHLALPKRGVRYRVPRYFPFFQLGADRFRIAFLPWSSANHGLRGDGGPGNNQSCT